MFVSDSLQIPKWCIQICSGSTAPTCTSWLQTARRKSLFL